jgi:lysozyme
VINFSRLETRIMNDEGFEARPYLDTVGVPTIGYGTTHILGKPVSMDAQTMTPAIAREVLRSHLYGALVDAQKVVKNFDELDSVRQEVVVNMVFNLGAKGLSKFVRFLAALEAHSYTEASDEMQDSRWYYQTHGRAKRLQWEMQHGQISGPV